MGDKAEVEAPTKMSINIKLSNPFFIIGMVILVLCVICMFVYVFSGDEDSGNKGILIIGTPVPEPEPEPEQNDTYEKQCDTVSDCVGREKLEQLYSDPGNINDAEIDCLNTEEPYCLLETCLYPYKRVGEECGVGKECNSNRECTTITNIDLTNCQGDSEIFMPFHEWVNRLDVNGEHVAGGEVTGVFNGEIDKMVEYALDYHNKSLDNLIELRESSDEVKHGQIALARYMLKDIHNISNEEIATTITDPGWDGYNYLLDVSEIGFNDDSTTITKLEVDYCSEIPLKNNLEGSLPLYDLISSRFNPEQIEYLDQAYECSKKIIDVDVDDININKGLTCTTHSTDDDITCQYDEVNNTCLPTTSTPDFFDTTELANSLQNFDYCKAYYSRDGYNCIKDEESFLSFGGLIHVCKNDDKCV